MTKNVEPFLTFCKVSSDAELVQTDFHEESRELHKPWPHLAAASVMVSSNPDTQSFLIDGSCCKREWL